MHVDYYKKKPQFSTIFWDRPDIAKMSIKVLKAYVNNLKKSKDPVQRREFQNILRRFIERGFLTEAVMVFDLSEIQAGIDENRFWNHIPAWRINAWKNYLESYKKTSEKTHRLQPWECQNSDSELQQKR